MYGGQWGRVGRTIKPLTIHSPRLKVTFLPFVLNNLTCQNEKLVCSSKALYSIFSNPPSPQVPEGEEGREKNRKTEFPLPVHGMHYACSPTYWGISLQFKYQSLIGSLHSTVQHYRSSLAALVRKYCNIK